MQQARDSGVKPEALLVPFDVTQFGGPEDPCFGKELDLKSDECSICGDVELCSIAMMQGIHATRLLLEKEHKYKDLEEVNMIALDKAREFVNEKVLEGWGPTRIKAVIKRKFELTPKQIETLIEQ